MLDRVSCLSFGDVYPTSVVSLCLMISSFTAPADLTGPYSLFRKKCNVRDFLPILSGLTDEKGNE